MNTSTLADTIYRQARLAGYDDCGIIPIDEMDEYQARFQERLAKEPTSRPFYERIAPGMATKKRFPWAKSVIICTWWLGRHRLPETLEGNTPRPSFLHPKPPSLKRNSVKKMPLRTG